MNLESFISNVNTLVANLERIGSLVESLEAFENHDAEAIAKKVEELQSAVAVAQNAKNELGLNWRGELDDFPENPESNWVFFNTANKVLYAYMDDNWRVLLQAQRGVDATTYFYEGDFEIIEPLTRYFNVAGDSTLIVEVEFSGVFDDIDIQINSTSVGTIGSTGLSVTDPETQEVTYTPAFNGSRFIVHDAIEGNNNTFTFIPNGHSVFVKKIKIFSFPTKAEFASMIDMELVADGKSAYTLAVDNGYTGTVDEWLASLQPFRTHYDESTNALYITSDGSDPMPTI